MTFDVIVSSPFLRCLQTALILAKKFGTNVLIDQELGEVMGPPVFETEPPLPPRPWSNLQKTLKESEASSNVHSALRAGRFMGKQPQWAETLQQARLRYVKRYLDYLRRSRHTKRNFLLVTHGHMVQACATVLPAGQHRKVVSVDYCGAAVAGFHRLVKEIKDECHDDQSAFFPADNADPFNSDSQEAAPFEPDACQSEPPPEKNQVLEDAKTRYWTLRLRGVRTVPSSNPSGGPNLPNVGESWEDLIKLLGTLPPVGPAPSVTDAGSDCSFSTRASTAVSMNMLREPDGVPTSPKQSEKKQERQQLSRVDAKPPPAPQPLTLSTSRLAARRLKKPNVPDTVAEDQVSGVSTAADIPSSGRALLDCMNEALQIPQLRSPAPAEFALLQVGISSLARTAASMKGHEQQKLELQSFIEALDARAQGLERQRRSFRSVQPPGLGEAGAVSTVFGGFGRVLAQDVEHMKGEAKLGSLTLPSFPSALPAEIHSVTEAAETLTFEPKRELLRNLATLSRLFSGASAALSAIHSTREMDGARTCICASLVAMMDALLRRPLDLRATVSAAVQERHGDLFSLHYSGHAGGPGSPCRPFILSCWDEQR
eukprot:Skav211546  [mRNA]  locus=scaffold871:34706:45873:- [translate_table: standard]